MGKKPLQGINRSMRSLRATDGEWQMIKTYANSLKKANDKAMRAAKKPPKQAE